MNRRAATLQDVYRCFEPKPLLDPAEFEAFYVPALDTARGGQTIDRFRLSLEEACAGLPFKAFLMGHSGNGKSTELTRLCRDLSGQYVIVRIFNSIDPGSFKAFDVLASIMFAITEQASKSVQDGGLGYQIPDELIQNIFRWFSPASISQSEVTRQEASAQAAVGLAPDSWWAKLWGLSAQIKGEMKYAADRKKETVEYRLQRLSSLIDLLNQLIDNVRGHANEKQKDILLIVEEFDRTGMNPELVEELFVTYANIFQELRLSFIFTIPVSLGYSELNARLPITPSMLYDTPVFEQDFKPHSVGRAALARLLAARVDPALIEDRQADRMIIASGGNLRDLFALVRDAAATARLRKASQIGQADVDSSIAMLKRTVKARLAQGASDSVTYEQRVKKLIAIYWQQPAAEILDPVLLSLLRSRSVQEFNGKGRYAVAPLVVDLLKEQMELTTTDLGGTPS